MNSADTKKKKISEYQIEDIKEIFSEIFRKISSKVILLEIGNDFINIALAKSKKNKLYIKKVFRQELPKEALDQEIKKSLDILNKELSLKRHFLAFPFGSKADFNDEIIKRVLSSGYERCLLNVQGYNIQENNEFSLKRKVISNDTNLKYILG